MQQIYHQLVGYRQFVSLNLCIWLPVDNAPDFCEFFDDFIGQIYHYHYKNLLIRNKFEVLNIWTQKVETLTLLNELGDFRILCILNGAYMQQLLDVQLMKSIKMSFPTVRFGQFGQQNVNFRIWNRNLGRPHYCVAMWNALIVFMYAIWSRNFILCNWTHQSK